VDLFVLLEFKEDRGRRKEDELNEEEESIEVRALTQLNGCAGLFSSVRFYVDNILESSLVCPERTNDAAYGFNEVDDEIELS
jgi:hypothetical protein